MEKPDFPPPAFSRAGVTAGARFSGFALACLAASAIPDISDPVGGTLCARPRGLDLTGP